MKTKVCTKCKIEKFIDEFYKHKTTKDGYCCYCKLCLGKQQKKYYKENKKRIDKQCRDWMKEHPNSRKEYSDKYYQKTKEKVFNHYGNKCNCCGETISQFLTIDHINGGGNQHRKKIGCTFYNWLIRNNFPDGFQTLCFNCNWGKRVNGGICPHKDIYDGT